MTQLLDQALEQARNLPAEMQDDIARLVLAYTGNDRPPIWLTPEEEADVPKRRPKPREANWQQMNRRTRSGHRL